MKVNYNRKTKRFSLCNLTEDEANAILRSLSIAVEKINYNEKLGFYTDNGDCFALPTESYEAAEKLYNQLNANSKQSCKCFIIQPIYFEGWICFGIFVC